jgi:hypothetical protein
MNCCFVLARPMGVFPTRAGAMTLAGCSEDECVQILAGMAAAGEEICTSHLPGELQPFFRVQPAEEGGFLLLMGNRALAHETQDAAQAVIERIAQQTGERWTYLVDFAAPAALN